MMTTKGNFPLLAESDIVISGGGPAGVAAALAAARRGYRVLLLEQTGTLGGLATSGLVPSFAPSSDGERFLYGGIYEEIDRELCRRMGVECKPASWQAIDAEIMKRLLDDLVEAAGVRVLFGVKVCEAEVDDGRIRALWAATAQGIRRITGKQFIDATGDGMLAMLAGAEFEYGDKAGNTMSPTLCAQFANIDYRKYEEAYRNGNSDRAIWHRMLQAGTAPLIEHHFVCMTRMSPATATSNLGHIYGCNVFDPDDLTRGYREGRRVVRTFETFYREHVPGFENAVLVSTASLLGVRETRRIRGEYRMTFDDYRNRADFTDEIGRCCYPVDIHSSSLDSEEQKRVEQVLAATRFKHGESYGIPYRAMIPVGLRNLLVPGRALSSDREIQSSIRVMPPCFVTGQAAGIAAGMVQEEDVRSVDIAALQAALRELGGIFHQR